MKASEVVRLVLIGTPLFLAGCGCRTVVVEDPAARDGVPVVTYPMYGYHYSPFYHGYVPIIVPIGGYSGGNTYVSSYNSLPATERAKYAKPVARSQSAKPAATAKPSTPVTSGPTASSAPSKAATAAPAASGTTRGIAGGMGGGHISGSSS